MVAASSGQVHLRGCEEGATEQLDKNLDAAREVTPGSTGTGGTMASQNLATDQSSTENESEHSKGNQPEAPISPPEAINVGMPFKLLEANVRTQQAHVNRQAAAKSAPKPHVQLHSVFDPSTDVQPLEPDRFSVERELSEAVRNQGKVSLMWDSQGKVHVAAKQMPNSWICGSHAEFIAKYPEETEWPWQDVGCMRFLNSVQYQYGCTLHGVFKNRKQTAVMTTFASEGDLFNWCKKNSMPPGPERENLVRPLALQLFEGVRQLHELSIVHRDVSMENCLVSKEADGTSRLYIIDFGMADTQRFFTKEVRGKKSYVAPECHGGNEYDAFLADAFSVGVALYCVLLMEYPWQSTAPGACKCYDFVQKRGFRAFTQKRKLRNTQKTVAETLSESVVNLLDGLLSVDPSKRLTLGETNINTGNSVWNQDWVRMENK